MSQIQQVALNNDHPTIGEQIEAVERAITIVKTLTMSQTSSQTLIAQLKAAAETLRTLQFTTEIAR